MENGVLGEPRVDEPDIGQRRGIGAHGKVAEQRVARPLHAAARAELGAGKPHAREIDVERIAIDRDASFHIGDRESRVAALSRKPQHVDAYAPLARCLDPQSRKPRVEVLETANAVAAILTPRFAFFIGAGVAILLQAASEPSAVDLAGAHQTTGT